MKENRAFWNYSVSVTKKTVKELTGFSRNFSENPIQVWKGTTSTLYLNAPFYCCSLFFLRISQSPDQNQYLMVNKNSVDYHHFLSRLASRIYSLIFLYTPNSFLSPERLSSMNTLLWLGRKLHIYDVQFPEKCIESRNL